MTQLALEKLLKIYFVSGFQ